MQLLLKCCLWLCVCLSSLCTLLCVALGSPLLADNTTHPPNFTLQDWNSVFILVSQSEMFVSCMDEPYHNPSLATVALTVIGSKVLKGELLTLAVSSHCHSRRANVECELSVRTSSLFLRLLLPP